MADNQYKDTIASLQLWLNVNIRRMQRNLASDNANNSGTLRQSLGQNYNNGVTVSQDKILGAITAVDYWEYVDFGRRPGKKPPLRDILSWVQTKLPIRKELDWAYAKTIQNNIAKKGTKGNNFASDVLTDERIKELEDRIADSILIDFGKQIDEFIID